MVAACHCDADNWPINCGFCHKSSASTFRDCDIEFDYANDHIRIFTMRRLPLRFWFSAIRFVSLQIPNVHVEASDTGLSAVRVIWDNARPARLKSTNNRLADFQPWRGPLHDWTNMWPLWCF